MSRIIFINTAEPDRPNGSMIRYGAMVRDALTRFAPDYCVDQLNLAPSRSWLRRFPAALQTPIRYLTISVNARRWLPQQRDCVMHLLDGSHAYLLSATGKPTAPLVITVHDLIPMLSLRGELGRSRPGWMGAWIVRSATRNLRMADMLIADSENTRKDVISLTGVRPDRVRVVHPAISMAQATWTKPEEESAPSYILHVAGNNTFYKNRQGVVDVFKIIRQSMSVKLLMAGAPPDAGLLDKIRDAGLTSEIDFCTDISENELSMLYRRASLLLFPSLYEGFGWPPLEAMAQKCPVVCSNTGSLPEIVGNAALTAGPADVSALAGHCLRLLREPGLRQQMVAAGLANVRKFTPEVMADGLLKAYGGRKRCNAKISTFF